MLISVLDGVIQIRQHLTVIVLAEIGRIGKTLIQSVGGIHAKLCFAGSLIHNHNPLFILNLIVNTFYTVCHEILILLRTQTVIDA